MPLRSPEEKQPFLRERLEAEEVAEGWILMAGVFGGGTVLVPAAAPVMVPIALVSSVFAYSFRKRKAACDAIIDDPARDDFEAHTRPQRAWFWPERLSEALTAAQVELATLLRDGDALLRAAVRADERAQGAYRGQRADVAVWQGGLSDRFFDAFVELQPRTADAAAAVADEVARDPSLRAAVSSQPAQGRALVDVLPGDVVLALEHAGISRAALSDLAPTTAISVTENPAEAISRNLREYGGDAHEHASRLSEVRVRRPSPEERLRTLSTGKGPRLE